MNHKSDALSIAPPCHPSFEVFASYKVVGVYMFTAPSSSCDVDNGGCSENAKCIETKKGTKCRCNKGFEGDGKTCTGYGPI